MRMRHVVCLGLTASLVSLCSCSQQKEGTPCGGAPKCATSDKKTKKILYWTYATGYVHDCLALSEEVVAKLGKQSGAFDVVTEKGYAKKKEEITLANFTPEYLNQFDAVMWYVTGEFPMTEAQQKALIDFVKGGKAFIGIHSAADPFFRWPEFGEMIGGYFKNHPWRADDAQPVTIKVEDRKHPATKMLPADWTIKEEIYQFESPYSRKHIRVLMSLNTAKTDMNKPDLLYGKDGDYAVAWCRLFGQGRVFYTSLGHSPSTWNDPLYQKHLLGGITWALGLAKGDATPNPK